MDVADVSESLVDTNGRASILLRFVDSCTEFRNTAELNAFLEGQPQDFLESMDKQMDKDLIGHAHAFDSGIITREQLVKVLVPPFLKLIARVSHSLPESDSHLRAICDTLLCKWDKALSVILIGSSVPDGQGGSRLQMALRPQKRVELVKALVNAKYPEGLMESLLPGSSPRATALCFLKMFQMLTFNNAASDIEGALLVNKRLCSTLLRNPAVMNPLVRFMISNVAQTPVTDLELLATRAIILFKTIQAAGGKPFNMVMQDQLPGQPGVVELQRTADGQDLIVYSREFYEQAGIFLAIFHAGYHSSRELELRANRISEYPNQQPSTGPPATASRLVRVETSSSRAYEQTCASCKISGVSAKLLPCKSCRKVWYCGRDCQLAHWKAEHKKVCGK